jgi:hypothetical protein
MLGELRVARGSGLLSDERLRESVSTIAARRLGIPPPSLDPGAPADVVVLRRPLLEASEADVAVVVAGGVIRVLDPALVPSLGQVCESGRVETVNGVERWVCGQGVVSSGGVRPMRTPTPLDSSRTMRS